MNREICGECNEEWKFINGAEQKYQVSNKGRVKSMRNNKILKNSVGRRGYARVNLNGRTRYVHRLVAEAFIPNPKNLPIINHKDENKANNNANNLEWCDAKYNLEYNNGRERRAEPRRKAVYSIDENGRIERFASITKAAKAVDKSSGNICAVLKGHRNTIAGRRWFYE